MTPSVAPQPSQPRSQSANALMEGLQPPLRNALNSLNINLDYELARYRYAKRGEARPSVQPPQFQPRRRSLDLIAVPPPQPQRSPAPANPGIAPPPLPPNPRIQPEMQTTNAAVPPTAGEYPAGSPSQPISAVAALRSAIVHQPYDPDNPYLASSEALRQAYEPSHQSPYPESAASASTSRTMNLNTPLGLGALMLLLVASAGLGFLLVNPSVAQNLLSNTPLARFLPTTETEETTSSAADAEDADLTADFDEPPLTPLSPDLSQREFSDLDLNNLTSVPSASRPTGTAPVLGEDDADTQALEGDRATANVAPGTRPSTAARAEVNAIPRRTTPAPQPAPVTPTYQEPAPTPAPISQPAPVPERSTQPAPPTAAPTTGQSASPQSDTPAIADGESGSRSPVSSYYVVTDYTGDPSLDSAREVVDEAYVRNFDTGARIQLGAFNTPEGAAALVEELQQQGLDVEIYEP